MLAKQHPTCPTPSPSAALRVVPQRTQHALEALSPAYRRELKVLRELEKVAVLSEN